MPLRLPRRRTLAKLGLFLLAGAVVNVGVAWACSANFVESAFVPNERDFPLRWPMDVPDHWPSPQEGGPSYNDIFDIGADFRHYSAFVPPPEGATPSEAKNYAVTDVRAGLPLRSMRYFDVESPAPPRSERYAAVENELVGGIALRGLGYMAQGALPLIPIWSGAVVNTVFFTVLLYAPFGFLGLIIRSRRRARGLCPRCKYPLADLPTCPECGEAVRRKAAAS